MHIDVKELARIIYQDMRKGSVAPEPRKDEKQNEELTHIISPSAVYHGDSKK